MFNSISSIDSKFSSFSLRNYSEDELNEIFSESPTWKFLNMMHDVKYFWSPDNRNFFLMQELWRDGPLDKVSTAVAALEICIKENTYVPFKEWASQTAEINWLCVNDEIRGCGTLGVVCQKLIEAAEEAGIFLYGFARNFNVELPKLETKEGVQQWLLNHQTSLEPSLKKNKETSKALFQKYRNYGFCKYDATGFAMENRFFKKLSFGYKSSKLQTGIVADFVDRHLKC